MGSSRVGDARRPGGGTAHLARSPGSPARLRGSAGRQRSARRGRPSRVEQALGGSGRPGRDCASHGSAGASRRVRPGCGGRGVALDLRPDRTRCGAHPGLRPGPPVPAAVGRAPRSPRPRSDRRVRPRGAAWQRRSGDRVPGLQHRRLVAEPPAGSRPGQAGDLPPLRPPRSRREHAGPLRRVASQQPPAVADRFRVGARRPAWPDPPRAGSGRTVGARRRCSRVRCGHSLGCGGGSRPGRLGGVGAGRAGCPIRADRAETAGSVRRVAGGLGGLGRAD